VRTRRDERVPQAAPLLAS